jgi:predicted GIY-YIG superfamily endonuclease
MVRVALMDVWFVYIVRCADDSLYTGIARDVAARIEAHNAGKGARYTRGRRPVTLCVKRRCTSKGAALRLELAIKRLSRAEKERIVQTGRFPRLTS